MRYMSRVCSNESVWDLFGSSDLPVAIHYIYISKSVSYYKLGTEKERKKQDYGRRSDLTFTVRVMDWVSKFIPNSCLTAVSR